MEEVSLKRVSLNKDHWRDYLVLWASMTYMLSDGWPIFEKGGIEKSREMIYKEEGLDPLGNCVIYNAKVI